MLETSQVLLLSCGNKVFAGEKVTLGPFVSAWHTSGNTCRRHRGTSKKCSLLHPYSLYNLFDLCQGFSENFSACEGSLLTCKGVMSRKMSLSVIQARAAVGPVDVNIQGRVPLTRNNKKDSQSHHKECIVISVLQRKANLNQQSEQAKLPSFRVNCASVTVVGNLASMDELFVHRSPSMSSPTYCYVTKWFIS